MSFFKKIKKGDVLVLAIITFTIAEAVYSGSAGVYRAVFYKVGSPNTYWFVVFSQVVFFAAYLCWVVLREELDD